MKIHIENIGAIEKMDVDFDGITIIGGENNTGKSTIGKIFFACYQNMAVWENIYSNFVQAKIEQYLEKKSVWLEDFCMEQFSAKRRRTSKAQALRKKYSNDEDFRIVIEDLQIAVNNKFDLSSIETDVINDVQYFLECYCKDYMHLYAKKTEEDIILNHKEDIEAWLRNAAIGLAYLNIDELEVQAFIINESFKNIFRNQYIRIGCDTAKAVITDDDKRTIRLVFDKNRLHLSAPVRTNRHVYYLESPKIYDLLSRPETGMSQKVFLRKLLSPDFIEANYLNKDPRGLGEGSLDDINLISNDSILDDLRTLMGGNADYYQKVGIEFKDNSFKETIHPQNVSTGLKSIALLEYALRIGVVLPGDVLILDEPEINLHPKWQVEYAKFLVVLQKKFDLKIIISSHSPYFIRAIEIFCDKNESMDNLNVYLTERNDNNVVIGRNLSYSEYGMSELYDLLASPLDRLESLLEDE